jgi:hypothetical protein
MAEYALRGPQEIKVKQEDAVVLHMVVVNDEEGQPYRILNTFAEGALRFR